MPTKVQIAALELAARRRAEKESRIICAMESAVRGGATLVEIVESASISTSKAYRYLADLRAAGRVHIGDWLLLDRRWACVYVAGPGDDAERPSLDDVRDDQVENEMRAETLEQHRRWADSWKPQRADAVWF